MTNTLIKGLPSTTSYWIEDNVFFIKHTSFQITLEESNAISALILQAMNDSSIKGIVVNNREAKGAWPKEIVDNGQMDQTQQKKFMKKRVATLTNSTITTMQMNRVARNSQMEDWSKAFNTEYNDEVKAFLLGKS